MTMTKTKYQFIHHVKLTVDNGNRTMTLENDPTHMLEIHFNLPFSSNPVPNVCTVTIYNLSQTTRDFFKKNAHVVMQAGYTDDIGVLTEGHINKIQPLQWSGVDSQFIFTFIEGTDYSTKGDVSMTFKKGSSTDTVIKGIAKKAGIPIKSISLQVPKTYTGGYTADGQPLDLVQEVAQKCGSVLRVVRGVYKVVYDDSITDLNKVVKTRTTDERSAHTKYLNAQKKTATARKSMRTANQRATYRKRVSEEATAKAVWQEARTALTRANKAAKQTAAQSKKSTATKSADFLLSFETGLMEEPTYSDDDDGARWNFNCLLQHRIAVGSVIQIKSKSLSRTMTVESGEHSFDGSSFMTTGVLK